MVLIVDKTLWKQSVVQNNKKNLIFPFSSRISFHSGENLFIGAGFSCSSHTQNSWNYDVLNMNWRFFRWKNRIWLHSFLKFFFSRSFIKHNTICVGWHKHRSHCYLMITIIIIVENAAFIWGNLIFFSISRWIKMCFDLLCVGRISSAVRCVETIFLITCTTSKIQHLTFIYIVIIFVHIQITMSEFWVSSATQTEKKCLCKNADGEWWMVNQKYICIQNIKWEGKKNRKNRTTTATNSHWWQ